MEMSQRLEIQNMKHDGTLTRTHGVHGRIGTNRLHGNPSTRDLSRTSQKAEAKRNEILALDDAEGLGAMC